MDIKCIYCNEYSKSDNAMINNKKYEFMCSNCRKVNSILKNGRCLFIWLLAEIVQFLALLVFFQNLSYLLGLINIEYDKFFSDNIIPTFTSIYFIFKFYLHYFKQLTINLVHKTTIFDWYLSYGLILFPHKNIFMISCIVIEGLLIIIFLNFFKNKNPYILWFSMAIFTFLGFLQVGNVIFFSILNFVLVYIFLYLNVILRKIIYKFYNNSYNKII